MIVTSTSRRTLRAALALAGALLVAYFVGLLLPGGTSFLVDVVLSISTQWAAVLVFIIAATQTRFQRLDIVLATLAVALSAFGDTYYALAADSDGYLPSPSLADAGYLLFYPFMVAAILVLAHRRRRARSPAAARVALCRSGVRPSAWRRCRLARSACRRRP